MKYINRLLQEHQEKTNAGFFLDHFQMEFAVQNYVMCYKIISILGNTFVFAEKEDKQKKNTYLETMRNVMKSIKPCRGWMFDENVT